MNILSTIGLIAGWLYAFFLAYVAAMGLYRCYLARELNLALRILGAPVLAVGILMDVAANATLAWLLFMEPPREWMVTTRLRRYIRTPSEAAWRRAMANWTCDYLLNPFDPRGRHC